MEYDEKSKATTDVAATMSTSAENIVTFTSGIEYGLGDDDGGLSAQDV